MYVFWCYLGVGGVCMSVCMLCLLVYWFCWPIRLFRCRVFWFLWPCCCMMFWSVAMLLGAGFSWVGVCFFYKDGGFLLEG